MKTARRRARCNGTMCVIFGAGALGGLSAAARQLAVEHSTVARRADALEKSLAVRLFDRLAKGWALTAEGEAFAGACCAHG